MNRREARREFKTKKTPKGIFAIRCTVSGEVWVGTSTHLDTEMNGAWYQLRNGLHQNKRMQAAWNQYGKNAFTYEVLETFDDELSPLLLKDHFAQRRKHWEHAMGVAAQSETSRS